MVIEQLVEDVCKNSKILKSECKSNNLGNFENIRTILTCP